MAISTGVDQLFDLGTLEGQRQSVLAMLRTVSDEVNKLNQMKVAFGTGPDKTKEVVSGVNELGNSVGKLGAKLSDAERAQKNFTKSQLEGLRVAKEQASVDKITAQTAKENARAKEVESRMTAMLTKEKERQEKLAAREVANANKLQNAYEILKIKYRDAANEAKRFGAELGTESKEFLEASNAAMNYWNQLDKIESSVGQAQRRVGQYERAQFSLNQVLREVPAFANSVQTGFMAISNNLPILSDEFKKLRESTGSTGQALKILMGGLFSWNTAMVIGITALTVYGKEIGEFVKGLFKGVEAFDKFKESQKVLNDSLASSEYTTAIEQVESLRINVELAKNGFIDKDKVVNQYNETLGKSIGQVKSLDEVEASLIKNADAYVQMTLFKASANLALEEAAKKTFAAEQARIKTLEQFGGGVSELRVGTGFGGSFQAGEYNKQTERIKQARADRQAALIKKEEDAANEFKAIAKKFQTQAANIADTMNFADFFGGEFDDDSLNKEIENERRAALELLKFRAELEAEFQKETAEIQFLSLQKRIEARRAQTEAEIDALKIQSQIELTAEGVAASEKIRIREQLANDIRIKESKLMVDIIAIRKQSAEVQKKVEEDTTAAFLKEEAVREQGRREAVKAEMEAAEGRNSKRVSALSQGRDIELKALEGERKEGLFSEEEFQARRLAIEEKYDILILRAQLDLTKEVLAMRKARDEDVSKEEAKIAELELKILRAKNATILKEEGDLNSQRRKLREDLGRQIVAAAFEMASFSFEKQKNEIQEQIDLLEQKKQKDIEVANATIANEQDRAAAITTINARAAAQKEQLELRQRRIDQERARFEKLAATLTIAIETAKKVFQIQAEASVLLSNPVTAPLAPLALSQIPFVIASGAIAAALIAAKPIPKYATGTDDHKGGMAVVGDAGKKEMVVTPSGDLYITSDKPQLVNLPKHSMVLPDAEQVMNDINGFSYRKLQSASGAMPSTNKEVVKELKQLQEAVKNIPGTHITHSYNGLTIGFKNANRYWEWHDRHMQ